MIVMHAFEVQLYCIVCGVLWRQLKTAVH